MRTSEIIMLIFCCAQDFQRAFAGGDGHGLESLAAEKGIQQAALAGVVIHDQERGACGLALEDSDGHALHSFILSLTCEMRKSAPAGSLARHSISQPWARTICWTTARPRPVPSSWVVK